MSVNFEGNKRGCRYLERTSLGGFPLSVELKGGNGPDITGITQEYFPGQGIAREMSWKRTNHCQVPGAGRKLV